MRVEQAVPVGVVRVQRSAGGSVVACSQSPEREGIAPEDDLEVKAASGCLGIRHDFLDLFDAGGPEIDGFAWNALAKEEWSGGRLKDGEWREPVEAETSPVLELEDFQSRDQVETEFFNHSGLLSLRSLHGCVSLLKHLFAAAHGEVDGGGSSADECDEEEDACADERGLAPEEEGEPACAARVSPLDGARGEPCVEVFGERMRGGVAVCGNRREGTAADGIEIGIDFRAQGTRGGGRGIGAVVARGDLRGGIAVGGLADEEEVEETSEGVDIGGDGLGSVLAAELLGGGEGEVADGCGIGDSSGIGTDGRGNAEVGNLGDAVLGEQDVGGLEVAVDDTCEVGGVDAAADLGDELGGMSRGEGFCAFGEPLGEVAIVDVLVEDVIHAGFVGGAIEDADDVRMADASGLAGLGGGLGCGIDVEDRAHALDGDPCGAIGFGELAVGGEVDLALGSDAEPLADIEAPAAIGHARSEVAGDGEGSGATGGAREGGGGGEALGECEGGFDGFAEVGVRGGEGANGIGFGCAGVDGSADGELDGGIERDSEAGESGDRVEVAGEGVGEGLVEAFAGIGLDDIGELVIRACAGGLEDAAHGRIGL